MSSRCLSLAFSVLLASNCKREWRDLRISSEHRDVPALSYRESELDPGGRPSIEERQSITTLPRGNPYGGNAYAISQGQQLFVDMNCSGCHGEGGGGIGPALMDRNWLYGETPERIYESIARGRPNGMPAWGTRLPEFQIWQLTTYVHSLGGLEPKSAQGARNDSLERASENPSRPAEDIPARPLQ